MASNFAIRYAIHCVRRGGIIAYPTETVYGLGCDPLCARAVNAINILKGRDNEATVYFMDKTGEDLHRLFKPVIGEAMLKVGVTGLYKNINEKIRNIPFTQQLSFDLDEYVTNKALDGLFKMLAEEEKKIRTDPSARVTKLLKTVFN